MSLARNGCLGQSIRGCGRSPPRVPDVLTNTSSSSPAAAGSAAHFSADPPAPSPSLLSACCRELPSPCLRTISSISLFSCSSSESRHITPELQFALAEAAACLRGRATPESSATASCCLTQNLSICLGNLGGGFGEKNWVGFWQQILKSKQVPYASKKQIQSHRFL